MDKSVLLSLIAFLMQMQSSPKRQTYQLFLHNVHRKCDPRIVLVCVVALGLVRVVGMRKRERATLIHDLEAKKDQLPLGSQVLRSLATRCNVPREGMLFAQMLIDG